MVADELLQSIDIMTLDTAPSSKSASQSLKKEDWTLLVIDAVTPKTLTPLQLQKALFLVGQRIPEAVGSRFYHFVPYNYGPFCKEIYTDAENLGLGDLVEEVSKHGQKWPEYGVSAVGHERARMLRKVIPAEIQEYFDELVKWVEKQSFQDLLHAVYSAYPDFAKNSVFNG